MSEVLDVLRDEPDPDGALTLLADRIAAERERVRAFMALGEAREDCPTGSVVSDSPLSAANAR